MDGGPPKNNRPTSHPSNLIHKVATAKQGRAPAAPVIQTPATEEKTPDEPIPTAGSGSESHDVNKIALIVGVVVIAGLAFLTLR